MSLLWIVAAVLLLGLGWHYFVYKLSGRPWWNPLWMAFTITAVALLYGIAGLLGYEVPRHNPFIGQSAVWVGHVVWSQVALASMMLLISGVFWWLGLRGLPARSN